MNFSLNKKRETDDGYVIREGLIFEAGDYPDKKFQLSQEELLAVSADFKPASINLEHISTIFDGKLGFLSNVKPLADGSALYGEAKLPKWFDDLFADEPIKVSCEWNRKNKSIKGLALTTRPRIEDAALMSAFSDMLVSEGKEESAAFSESLAAFEYEVDKNKTWAGADVLQRIHNICSESGAVCWDPDKTEGADFIAKKEAESIQKMHDASVKGGAKCYFMPANYSKTEKDETMNPIEKLKAKFNDWAKEVQLEETPEEVKASELEAKFAQLEEKINTEKAALEAKFSELAEAAKLEKEILEAKNKELADALAAKTAEVETFSTSKNEEVEKTNKEVAKAKVEDLVKAGKLVPAKSEQLEAVFSVLIDNKTTVNFNDKTDVDAVEALFSLFDGVVSLKEEIPTEGTALANAKSDDMTAEIEKAKADARAWAKKMNKRG